jgi:O-antigen ligase
MIKDFVLFGTGLGTFRYIYPVYRTLTVQAPIFYAHSDFLQLISETGLLGLGLAFWLLFLFYKEVFSAWLTRHDPFVKGITIAGLSAMLAILLHSFFDFGLQIPANALFFTVTSAMVYKCIFIKFKEDEPVQVP